MNNKLPPLPKPMWIAVETPGADSDITFVATDAEAFDLAPDAHFDRLYTAEQMREHADMAIRMSHTWPVKPAPLNQFDDCGACSDRCMDQEHGCRLAQESPPMETMTPASAGIDFPQVGFAGPFPIVEGRIRLPDETMADLIHHARTGYVPVTPAGGEVVAYRYVADEGVYNPFVRDWLDGSPDQLDLENIARHPGVRFEFAYSNPPVPDHELQQKWFRRGWDMYVEIHGETHPPVADAALVAALTRITKFTDDPPYTSCQGRQVKDMRRIAEEALAALNQRGGLNGTED